MLGFWPEQLAVAISEMQKIRTEGRGDRDDKSCRVPGHFENLIVHSGGGGVEAWSLSRMKYIKIS